MWIFPKRFWRKKLWQNCANKKLLITLCLNLCITLCEGNDSTTFANKKESLRPLLLLLCFMRQEISPFSFGPAVHDTSKFKTYCLHYLTIGGSMIDCFKCREWFHYTYVDILDIRQKGNWFGSGCTWTHLVMSNTIIPACEHVLLSVRHMILKANFFWLCEANPYSRNIQSFQVQQHFR